MDKRSWPWKKKLTDKQAVEKAFATASDSSKSASDSGTIQANKDKEDNNGKPKHVQVSVELYTHLTGLEDQVKSYEEHAKTLEGEVEELKEKLSEAHIEITDKENTVTQHAKVAEEAISGWEKAEAEAESWKNDLESVTLLKLTAEDRASQLDGALKECMRQIRNLKEDHDQKMQQLVLNKTNLFDQMKFELESNIANLEQELLKSAAEKNALSRSLNERSNMLIKLSEEKSQAESEIKNLKTTIESCEKEVNSLKYELRIAWKEAEIRNEEKNMSARSAEVANKQHHDGLKKISKLEAECQRLRGLVRKKLPGAAALAQMKLEAELDYEESYLRRSSFSLESAQKYLEENELLVQRLLETEEEMKMLKESLGKRDNIYAETVIKLQSLEAQLQSLENKRGLNGAKSGNLQSFGSFSEGNDDNVSCAGSWAATGLVSELSRFRKNVNSPHKSENSHLDLMDDFLEMEKLAYQSNDSNSTVSSNKHSPGHELVKSEPSTEAIFSNEDAIAADPQIQADQLILRKLLSKVCTAQSVLESMTKENYMEKSVADIQHIMLDMHEILQHQFANGVVESNLPIYAENGKVTAEMDLTVEVKQTSREELQKAISQICGFLVILGKEMKSVSTKSPDGDELDSKLNMLSAKYSQAIGGEIGLTDFVLDISHALSQASEPQFNVLGYKNAEAESGNSECIDKVALPENKILNSSSKELYPNGCTHFSNSALNSDVTNDGILVPTSESRIASLNCCSEEIEQLKLEKDKLTGDLAICVEDFDRTKAQLLETEKLFAEVKSQLTSVEKSNSLAETQLKCMAESYGTLEERAKKLESEVNLLQGRIENLETELQEEREKHEDALFRCKNLQEQLQRLESCAKPNNDTTTQEELTAATEKLAECQKTIFLLGKQFNAMRPQSNIPTPADLEEEPTVSSDIHLQDNDPPETNIAVSSNLLEADAKPLLDLFDRPFNQPDSESSHDQLKSPVSSKYTTQRSSTKSGSQTPPPDKQARGFSRFFSPKGKTG